MIRETSQHREKKYCVQSKQSVHSGGPSPLQSQEARVLAVALHLLVCVTLGKSLHFSGPHLLHQSNKSVGKDDL